MQRTEQLPQYFDYRVNERAYPHSACSPARNAIHSAALAFPKQIYRTTCRRFNAGASVRLDLWLLRFCPAGWKGLTPYSPRSRQKPRAITDEHGPPCSPRSIISSDYRSLRICSRGHRCHFADCIWLPHERVARLDFAVIYVRSSIGSSVPLFLHDHPSRCNGEL